jgi:tetratricopeptide (TPR) repeat protein
MRKLLIALISSVAIALPIVSPALAEELQAQGKPAITYYEGMIDAWKKFAAYDPKGALRVLDQIDQVSINPAERQLMDLMRLTIYRQTGNLYVYMSPDEAIQFLTEAIALDDTSVHARNRRAQANCEIGNFEACQRDYAVAWQLTTDKSQINLASHLSRRGHSYFDAGRKQEGTTDLKEAIRLFQLSGEQKRANLYQGLLNELLGQQ